MAVKIVNPFATNKGTSTSTGKPAPTTGSVKALPTPSYAMPTGVSSVSPLQNIGKNPASGQFFNGNIGSWENTGSGDVRQNFLNSGVSDLAFQQDMQQAQANSPAHFKGWMDQKPAGMTAYQWWLQQNPGRAGTGNLGDTGAGPLGGGPGGGSGGGGGGVGGAAGAATSNMSSLLQQLIDTYNKNPLKRESSAYYAPLQKAILNPSYAPTSASEQGLLNALKDQTQGASATRGLGPATAASLAQSIAPTLVDLRQKNINDLQTAFGTDMNQLVTQRAQDLQNQLGQMGIGAQLRNQDLVNALGYAGIDTQRYGIDKNYALGAGNLSLQNLLAMLQYGTTGK